MFATSTSSRSGRSTAAGHCGCRAMAKQSTYRLSGAIACPSCIWRPGPSSLLRLRRPVSNSCCYPISFTLSPTQGAVVRARLGPVKACRIRRVAPPEAGSGMAVQAPPFQLERLGVVMEPLPGEPREVEGVLNPASARGRDGELYLFPRTVARGNFSRIGGERVVFDKEGKGSGVERLGGALEPDEAWEQNTVTAGVEDPRITFIDSLNTYVMAYAAYGPLGPRIGLAVSRDLVSWERLGPVSFDYQSSLKTDLNLYCNKDAMFFPEPVPGPDGKPAYAMLHRPMWDLSWVSRIAGAPLPAGVTDPRHSIWVSFVPADAVKRDVHALTRLGWHRQGGQPHQPWEPRQIGGGPPAIPIPGRRLIISHPPTPREAPTGLPR